MSSVIVVVMSATASVVASRDLPVEKSPTSHSNGRVGATAGADPSVSILPEPPEEPLQSDCCGTGCSPCVFDIYQEELEQWRELASLSPEERLARLQSGRGKREKGSSLLEKVLSAQEYQTFEVVEMNQVSSDAWIFSFSLPKDCVLGVGIGQHAVLR